MEQYQGNNMEYLYRELDRGGAKGAGNSVREIGIFPLEKADGSQVQVGVVWEIPSSFNTPWQHIKLVAYDQSLDEDEKQEIQKQVAELYYSDLPFI